jgi:outer membrane protein TolC
LLSLERSLSSSSRNLGSAKAQYLPKLGASASYTLSDGTRGDTATYNYSSKSFSYGFRVSWSIFDGFARERQVTQAKVTRNNVQAGLADARNLTISDIKTAYYNIEQLKEQKAVAGENVAAATEDIKITQEKYNLGAATILDLLDAQVSLKRAEVSRISADFDLNLAISKLEKSMGKL